MRAYVCVYECACVCTGVCECESECVCSARVDIYIHSMSSDRDVLSDILAAELRSICLESKSCAVCVPLSACVCMVRLCVYTNATSSASHNDDHHQHTHSKISTQGAYSRESRSTATPGSVAAPMHNVASKQRRLNPANTTLGLHVSLHVCDCRLYIHPKTLFEIWLNA